MTGIYKTLEIVGSVTKTTYKCENCGEDGLLITEAKQTPEFCPFCGLDVFGQPGSIKRESEDENHA